MSSKVILRKNGGFYSAYGDDAYILYYLLNYKIIGDKVGFPKSAFNKVINLLEDNHISYEVDGNIYDFKNRRFIWWNSKLVVAYILYFGRYYRFYKYGFRLY